MKISKKQLTKACWYNIICRYDVRRNSLHQSPGVNLFSIESTMKIISKLKFIGGQPMKTYMANPDKIERKWYVVDARQNFEISDFRNIYYRRQAPAFKQ